jgi:hypothetical protein
MNRQILFMISFFLSLNTSLEITNARVQDSSVKQRRVVTSIGDVKRRFESNAATLLELSEIASRLNNSAFESPEEKERVRNSIQNVTRSVVFVQRQVEAGKLHFSEEVLTQINGLTELMNLILGELNQSDPVLQKSDQRIVLHVQDDIQRKMSNINDIKGLDPPEQIARYPQFLVTARTLKRNGKEESLLTIYYVPQAMYGTNLEKEYTRSFGSLSSPSKQELPEADYFIWAGRGVDRTPVTKVKDLIVRKPSGIKSILIDLMVDK